MVSNEGGHFVTVVASIILLNNELKWISQIKSEFSYVVQMVRNHIAEKHFISKVILSVSNWHERLREAEICYRFDVKCQIWRHDSSPCFKAVLASPKLYSITHKSFCTVWPLDNVRRGVCNMNIAKQDDSSNLTASQWKRNWRNNAPLIIYWSDVYWMASCDYAFTACMLLRPFLSA